MSSSPERWNELTESARDSLQQLVHIYADRVNCQVHLNIAQGGTRDFRVTTGPDVWLQKRNDGT